jgi:hypothetical protein
MRTNQNQSGEKWIVTLRSASAGSTATVFPMTLGQTVCAASSHRTVVVQHQQTVWTCALPLLDVQLSVATSVDLTVARSR